MKHLFLFCRNLCDKIKWHVITSSKGKIHMGQVYRYLSEIYRQACHNDSMKKYYWTSLVKVRNINLCERLINNLLIQCFPHTTNMQQMTAKKSTENTENLNKWKINYWVYLKTLWQQEKFLIMMNFSLSDNIFKWLLQRHQKSSSSEYLELYNKNLKCFQTPQKRFVYSAWFQCMFHFR